MLSEISDQEKTIIVNNSQRSSVYESLKRRSTYSSLTTFGKKIKISARSILPHYQCPNNKIYQFVFPDSDFCTPYNIDYAHTIHDGNMLAVGDEEGRLTLLRTDKENDINSVDFHHSFYCHPQPILDVKWSQDDTMLVTASIDRLARVWDVDTRTCLAEFPGHKDAVKSVNWHPSNIHLLITGSKDGSYKIWDTRVNQRPMQDISDSAKVPSYNPIKTVDSAHVVTPKKSTSRSSNKPQPLILRSVTCAMFVNNHEEKVISSGSSDGQIKLWDIRAGRTPRAIESTCFASENGKRHGLTDLKIDSSGTRLFSCCLDNTIYMHYLNNLTRPACKYSDPEYRVGDFTTKLSISPDDQFLLSGSFKKEAFVWEIGMPNASPHVYEGHNDKVTGVSWSKSTVNQFSTCSDDFTVRVWNCTL